MMDFFTKITYPSESDTSKVLNTHSKSLYQISTEVVIESSQDVEIDPSTVPVKFVYHNKGSALSIGSVLHVLHYNSDNAKMDKPILVSASISDMKFICQNNILVCLLMDGFLVFKNFSRKNDEYKLIFLDECFTSNAEIIVIEQYDGLKLMIKDANAVLYVEFPNYNKFLDIDFSSTEKNFLDFVADGIVNKNFEAFKGFSSYFVIPADFSSLILLPSNGGDILRVEFDDKLKEPVTIAECEQLLQVDVYGSYVIALTSNGTLKYLDIFTGMWYQEFDLRLDSSFTDEILYYKFIDHHIDDKIEGLKLFLITRNDRKSSQAQIRSFPENNIIHSVKASISSQALAFTTEYDNVIIFVDPFSSNHDEEIRIRAIYEAHPETRFERLLAMSEFDEAERFAEKYGLDIQKVHHYRLMDMTFDEDEEENKKTINTAIEYFDKITDDNNVGDICITFMASLYHRSCIQQLFSYIEKRNVVDVDTLLQLSRSKYHFVTMCAVSCDINSIDRVVWQKIIKDDSFVGMFFLQSCLCGVINTARLLWKRYYKEIMNYLVNQEKLNVLLDLLAELVLVQPTKLSEVIEFIQFEYGPQYLLENDSEEIIRARGNFLIQFTHKLITELEVSDISNFPENSLMASQLVHTILKTILGDNITPAGSCKSFVLLAYFNMTSKDPADPMGRLNICTMNLEKLSLLKKQYDCTMSYAVFVQNTPKSICFRMFDKCKNAGAVSQEISKYILPYIKENGLKKDEVILDYIKEASSINENDARTLKTWDVLYLSIIEFISDASKKCLAIVNVAKKSSIPWSSTLKEAVDKIKRLKNLTSEASVQLEMQCKREELGNLFKKLNVPLTIIDSVAGYNVTKIFVPLFYSSMDNANELKKDCIMVCQLLSKIRKTNVDSNIIFTASLCRAICKHVEKTQNLQLLHTAFQLFDTPTLMNRAVQYFSNVVKMKLNLTNRLFYEQRFHMIDISLIVLSNYAPQIPEYEQLQLIIKDIRNIQELYDVLVPINLFEKKDEVGLKQYVIKFIESNPKPPLGEIINFGQLFGFSKATCCHLFIEYSEKNVESYLLVLTTLTKPHCELNKNDVLLAIDYLKQVCDIISELANDPQIATHTINCVAVNFDQFKSITEKLFLLANEKKVVNGVEILSKVLDFFQLIGYVLECFTENHAESNDANKDEENNESIKIYGMTAKLGIVSPKDLGVMYDVECLVNLCKVGRSIFNDNSLNSTSCFDEWLDVYNSLLSNPFINFKAHLLAYRIGATQPDKYVVAQLCQKLLTFVNFDLFMAICVVSTLDKKEIENLLIEIGKWSSKQQGVHIAKNTALLAQSISMIFGINNMNTIIKEKYREAYWQGCFSKNNLNIGNVNDTQNVHEYMCKKLCNPEIYANYCNDYQLGTNSVMLKYGFRILKTLPLRENELELKKAKETASKVLSMIRADPTYLFEQGFLLLDQLSPYNYEGAYILLKEMEKWIPQNEKIYGAKSVIQFLQENPRRSCISVKEVKWYLERSKLQREGSDTLTFDSVDMEAESSIAIDENTTDIENLMPKSSIERLPFHMLISGEVFKNLFTDVINNEIKVEYVKPWLDLVSKKLEIPSFSRTYLVTAAVGNKVCEVINCNSTLSAEEIALITELLHSASQKRLLLQQLGMRIKKLPLCESKLVVSELFLECALIWYNNKQFDAAEQDEFDNILEIYKRFNRRLKTEFYLAEMNIPLIDRELTDKADELVRFVLSQHTDWNNPDDITKKMSLCKTLVGINNADINEILFGLVKGYFEGGNAEDTYLRPTFTCGNKNENFMSGTSLFTSLPYSETDVARLTFILNELSDPAATLYVAQRLKQTEVCSNILLERMKILCILIRHLDEGRFQQFFGTTFSSFALQFQTIVIEYCMKICGLDNSVKDYYDLPAEQLITTLTSGRSGVRICSESTQLATALAIDRKLPIGKNLLIFERLLKRLLQFKCIDCLKLLLNYITKDSAGYAIKNLSSYYVPAFDYIFNEMKYDENVPVSHYRNLVYFMTTCPIVKKDGFRSVVDALIGEDMHKAASLLNAISNSTRAPLAVESSEKDIHLDDDPLKMMHELLENQTVVENEEDLSINE